MDDERTTQEVIHLLGEDVERCHGALLAAIDAGERDADGNVDADYEFHARQLIRAVFAYIEATTFSVKASSAWKCMEEDIDIPPKYVTSPQIPSTTSTSVGKWSKPQRRCLSPRISGSRLP
jgi:hypothetical protein